MKKNLYFLLFIFLSAGVFAQAPMQFNYQAVIRNTEGQPISNQQVSLEISILKENTQGPVVFTETHSVQTNEFGLVNLQIGSVESLSEVDWSLPALYIQVSVDGNVMGTTQLLSVPFALHAQSSADAFSGNYSDLENTPDLSSFITVEEPHEGGIILKTTSGWQTIAPGQEGQVLSIVGGTPQWANLPDSGGGEDPNTVTDVQGNVYQTIQIGNQWWMAENLRTSQYSNGDEIPTGLEGQQWEYATAGAYAIYNNDDANNTTYGKVYNWLAVNDARGICPAGWSVPSDDDWKTLEMELGMTQAQADGAGLRGTDQGGQLKSTGTELWNAPNTGATNSSEFTALPGGAKSYPGEYILQNSWGYFWTSTYQTIDYSSWYRVLQNNSQQVFRYYNDQRTGMSIRCVKD